MGRCDEPCTFFEGSQGLFCTLKIDEEEPLKRFDPNGRRPSTNIAATGSSPKNVLSGEWECSDRAGNRVPETAGPPECRRGFEMEAYNFLADPDALQRTIRVRIEEPQDLPPTHAGFVQSVGRSSTP